MSEKRGTKALEVWCRRVTEGYPGVKVENMTTSWRDGLAFCALIHHFRPDLIDFDSLDKRDVYQNNELAFRIAERHLGIPALLDAEDMVEYEVPDRLSMLTYLSQFYQTFVSQQGHSPNSRTPVKRSSVSPSLSSSPDLSPSMSPTSTSPPSKVPARGVSGGTSSRSTHDSCTHCGLPVFLAERLLVGSKRALYHRTCFRCARCSAQLTLANCYETEDGGFCCETCPDEETDKSDTSSQGLDGLDVSDSKRESTEPGVRSIHRNLSISDDEKSSEFQIERKSGATSTSDEYSALFESTIENFHRRNSTTQLTTGKTPLALTHQVPNDLVSKSNDSCHKTLRNSSVNTNTNESPTARSLCAHGGEPLDQCDELSLLQSTKESSKYLNEVKTGEEPFSDFEEKHGISNPNAIDSVYSNLHTSSDSSISQPPVCVSTEPSGVDDCTKDSKISSADTSAFSIVKLRKMMFENQSTNSSVENVTPHRKPGGTLNDSKPKGYICSEMEESLKAEENNFPVEKICREEDVLENALDLQGASEEKEVKSIVDVENISQEMKSIENLTKSKFDRFHEDTERIKNERVEQTSTIDESLKLKSQKEGKKNDILDVNSQSPLVSTSPAVSPRSETTTEENAQASRVGKETKDYPADLNPFGDEEDQESEPIESKETKKESTNPFGSSDEEEPVILRRKSVSEKPPRPPPPAANLQGFNPISSNDGRRATISVVPPTASPLATERKVIPAPGNLNPFWSDGEEPEEENTPVPVPLPRTIRLTPEPSPRPRTTVGAPSRMISSSGKFGSSSSLSSMASNTGTNRRSKKPAPAPPSLSSRNSSQSPSPNLQSPQKRKSRPAPPPPALLLGANQLNEFSSDNASLDGRKMLKDEANRSMQAVGKEEQSLPRDKSTFGQWKRKKGPAPPRPVPQRREVRAMPIKELKRELDDIEIKQLELERQGVKLEQTIRLKFNETPSLNESSMTPDVEDLVIQLFELVNEKNELFRKQAELMYLRRQQRLEEEHAELEYQIRCLMIQPESNKTDIMKAREEELIQRLVEVVERRNEIIECLEMDRRREAEEDQSIHTRLGLFAAKNVDSKQGLPLKNKKEKERKKEKNSKKKKGLKVDADKDIDEVEAAARAASKEKQSKKKWF